MLRPATPLSALVFVAFVLLLISVLSTPIIKGVKLGSYLGVDFGVFGFCKGSDCSGVTVGYNPGRLHPPGLDDEEGVDAVRVLVSRAAALVEWADASRCCHASHLVDSGR